MQYTKNYHLPQWVKEDRIMMDDFNAAMSAMENGMTASTQTANAARSDAAQAKENAQTALSQKPYVVGHYTGTGSTAAQQINLGFRPAFLIVSGMNSVTSEGDTAYYARYIAVTGGHSATNRIAITNTGFTTYPAGPGGNYPDLNEASHVYDYIAFK